MVKGSLERFSFSNSRGGRVKNKSNNTPEAFMALYCTNFDYGYSCKHIYFILVNQL